MPEPPPTAPLSDRPFLVRPARARPGRRPPEPSRNPFKRYWQAVTDADATWQRRLAVGVGVPMGAMAALGAVAVLAFAAYVAVLAPSVPDAYALGRATQAQPSVVLDVRGERLTQFEPAFREWVPLDSIPVHLVDGLIATEDRRFYGHGGVDVRRTVAAVWNTVRGRREGGSTITQQLARNLFPDAIGRSGTVRRKTMEMIAARRIERDHTKRSILEAYLNTVPFLYNAHGVETAARTYFGTTAARLTVPQAATLVAMLKGPQQFNPVRHPEAALARRNLVLSLMAAQGELSVSDAAAFRAEPLGVELRPQPSAYSAAPHFTAAVRRALEPWAADHNMDLERDGLVIRTTLDLSLQRAAEAAVAERGDRLQRTADAEWRRGVPRAALDRALRRSPAFDRAREQGLSADDALARLRADPAVVDSAAAEVRRVETALVAIQPETGAVRAYVGSRDFSRDEYDHAGVARRQPGSTFKAFVFAGALQRGYAPLDSLDGGSAAVELDDGTTWRPSGGSSRGTLEDALTFSKNAATARLTQEIGPHRVALVAERMGVSSDLDVVPSIGLGTSPVTLMEMVGAYGTIANDGLTRRPRLVTRIETANGYVLAEFGAEGPQALTRRDARNLLDMLRSVVDRGTGRDLRTLGVTGDLAGKTGTTQNYADGWFIALRPGLAVGAWVGFDDQRVTFRSKATGEGSKTALPVVATFLASVQDRLPEATLPPAPERYEPYLFASDSLDLGVDPFEISDEAFEWEVEDDLRPEPEVERLEEERPAVRERPDAERERSPRERALEAADRARAARIRQRRAEEAGPPPPARTNPNNAGGLSAEEILRRAREQGGGEGGG